MNPIGRLFAAALALAAASLLAAALLAAGEAPAATTVPPNCTENICLLYDVGGAKTAMVSVPTFSKIRGVFRTPPAAVV